MKKALFIDRDGTIIIEPPDTEQVDSLDKLEFYPRAISALARIAAHENYEFVMVTNQDGLGTKSFPEEHFWPAQKMMLKVLEGEGVIFDDVLIDKSLPSAKAKTRKPETGLLTKYLSGKYDLGASFVIGDRLTDMVLAKNIGAGGILLSSTAKKITEKKLAAEKLVETVLLKTSSWLDVAAFLTRRGRTAQVLRKTKETHISVAVNLDGTGRSDISTGIGFFDHMLEQLAKHSSIDLDICVKGDLHVDEHHTIEDTSLALGEALHQAMGKKIGIERYGFTLPMDEALASVAIDLSGRSQLVWDVRFKREKIGEMPTEMFEHFFKSLSDAAKCNINIKAEGENEHHKIESIFKAVARSLKMALKRDQSSEVLPSTKGAL